MKKLLCAVIAIVMSVLCACTLTGCVDVPLPSENAETAKQAVAALRTLYADKDTSTPSDYTVIGQTRVSGKNYAVTWTVTPAEGETANVSEYVTLGEMNETSKLVPVTITKGDAPVNYVLTASVTIGKATETVSFNRTVPAKPRDAAGTLEDPYSVAKAIELANAMEPKLKLEESDNPVQVYVQGYVVDCGNGSNASRVGFVYIVDEYSEDKDSKSPDAIMILSINYGEILTKYEDLAKGDLIVVCGYLMNYQKNATSDPQPEITYYGSNGVTCAKLVKPEDTRTDAEKVAAALEAFSLKAYKYTAAGNVALPTATVQGVTLSYASSNTELVTIDGNTMTVVKVPETETEVTLTVTAACGEESAQKEVTLRVVKETLATAHEGTEADPFTVADAKLIAEQLDGNTREYYSENGSPKQVYVKGYVVDCGTDYQGKRANNVYIVDEYSADKNNASADALQIYSLTYDSEVYTNINSLTKGNIITVKGYIQNYSGKFEITYSGSNNIYAVKIEKGEGGDPVTPPDPVEGEVTVSIADYATANGWANDTLYESVTVDQNVTVAVSAANPNATYGQTTGKYYTNGNQWRIYQAEKPEIKFTVTAGYKIVSIRVTYVSQNTGVITYNDEQYASDAVITVNAASAALSVGNSGTATNGQARITAISVLYEKFGENEHEHVYSYTHVEGTWTHLGACTVEGCTETVTADCAPVLNVCACGYTYTEAEILTALFALEKGQSLKGTYELTGEIISIAEQSTQYKNATFTIKVADKEIVAYRAKGTGYDTVKVGDTVTVTGSLMHYSNGVIEFGSGCMITNVSQGAEATPEEKVAEALAALTLPESVIENYALTMNAGEVVFSYASDNAAIQIVDNTMSVTRGAEAVTVKITVTATLGEYSATKEYTVVVESEEVLPTNYGTAEAPLSVSEALALAAKECANSNDVTAQIVYVKGVAKTTPESAGSYYKSFNLLDLDSSVEILVYSVNLNEGVAAPAKNDTLVVYGYIKNYNGTIEFTTNNGTYVYIYSNERGTSAITLGEHTGATVSNLPETAVNGAEVTFAVAAESGKQIASVKVNGQVLESSDGSYSFTMEGDATVTVETADEGQEVESLLYSLDQSTKGTNNSYTGNCDVVVEGVTWNIQGNSQMNPWRFGGKSITGTDRSLTSKTAIAGKVSKIDLTLTDGGSITVNSVTLKVTNAEGVEVSSIAIEYKKGTAVTVKAPEGKDWTNCTYQLTFNLTVGSSNKWVGVSKLEFYGFAA